MNLKIILLILSLLLLFIVAAILIINIKSKRKPEPFVNSNGDIVVGGAYDITENIYNELLNYVNEVGTTSYIEDYLLKNMGLKRSKPDSRANKEKYPKLYQIIDDVVFYSGVKTVDDFLGLTDLKYIHFLPKPKRCLFQYAYEIKIDSQMEKAIQKLFEKHEVYDQDISSLLPGLRLYKLAPGYAKKSTSIIKKAGAKAFEPDILAIRPLIAIQARLIKASQDRDNTIRTLSQIDTARLREFEINMLKKLLKTNELTNMNEVIRQNIKWEKKALEQERNVQRIKELEQQRKMTKIESDKLKLAEDKIKADEEEIAQLKQKLKNEREHQNKPEPEPEPEQKHEPEHQDNSQYEEEPEYQDNSQHEDEPEPEHQDNSQHEDIKLEDNVDQDDEYPDKIEP
jgi:hypothetical protein